MAKYFYVLLRQYMRVDDVTMRIYEYINLASVPQFGVLITFSTQHACVP